MGDIRTITVVGAGLLGRQIAYAAARAGYPTILEDISGQMIDLAMADLRRAAEEEGAPELLSRIQPERVLERAARADLIIEAAPDDPETQFEVYTILDRAAPPACLFAATAAAASITEVASLTYRAPQVLGMRFGAPVPTAGRLELVKGPQTSGAALAAAEEVGRRMGKPVSVVEESAGPESRSPALWNVKT